MCACVWRATKDFPPPSFSSSFSSLTDRLLTLSSSVAVLLLLLLLFHSHIYTHTPQTKPHTPHDMENKHACL